MKKKSVKAKNRMRPGFFCFHYSTLENKYQEYWEEERELQIQKRQKIKVLDPIAIDNRTGDYLLFHEGGPISGEISSEPA